MKKILKLLVLVITVLAIFSGCASESNGSKKTIHDIPDVSENLISSDTFVSYENIKYKVNPLLNEETDIDYADYAESNGMTSVEFGWNSFSNDEGEGHKDILIMYYDALMVDVQSGKQPILGSAYCHCNDDMTTEWSYFGAEHNFIYKNDGYQIYDENDNIIGYMTDDGTCYDNEDNPLNFNSFDPFIEVLNNFEG